MKYQLIHKKYKFKMTLTIERYKNGDVRYWDIWSDQRVFIASSKTSPLVLIDLFKGFEFINDKEN